METTNSDATHQDGDTSLDEDPVDDIDNDGDMLVDEDPLGDAEGDACDGDIDGDGAPNTVEGEWMTDPLGPLSSPEGTLYDQDFLENTCKDGRDNDLDFPIDNADPGCPPG